MTAPAQTAAPPTSSALDPGARELWSRWRRPAAVLALIVATSVVLGLAASAERRGFLDAEGVDAAGGRALARLLADQGVDLRPARTTDEVVAAAGPGTTVLVTLPGLLDGAQAQRVVETGADLVLVAPGQEVTAYLPGAAVAGVEDRSVLRPECRLPVARRAGAVRAGGVTYAPPEDAVGCYPAGGSPSLVVRRDGERTVAVLGAADPLTNRYLDDDGNAALAMGLLGARPRLVWYRPTLEAGDLEGPSLATLLPGWVRPVVAMLLLAGAAAALWRGRRLGPVVVEPLPVVVRSAEAVEGRARLYRRARASGHAAAALRGAAAERLRGRTGVPAGASDDALVAAVAGRSGRPPAAVAALLVGPEPADGAALVRLAHDLDALEQEVSRT